MVAGEAHTCSVACSGGSWTTKLTSVICDTCGRSFALPQPHSRPLASRLRPVQEFLFSEKEIVGQYDWYVEWRWKADTLVALYPTPPRPDHWIRHTPSGRHSTQASAEISARFLRTQFPGKVYRVIAHTTLR